MFFARRFPGLWGVVFLLVDVFRVFGSGFYWQVCCWVLCFFFLSWVGDSFRVFLSCLPHPLSVGAGLGNRATHLWLRTRFPSCRLGFRCFLTSSVLFSFLFFYIHFSLFPASSSPPPRRGWHGDDFSLTISSCPLRLRLPFIFFYVLCRLRCLAVQRCGSGFWGAASSTHVLVRGIGVSMISHNSAYIYGSSEWTCVMILLCMRLRAR